MQKCEFIQKLGELERRYQNCPTKQQLVEELYREFSQYDSIPNVAQISLKGHYSHRLLKKIMYSLGYTTTAKPCSTSFRAWRRGK